MAVKIVNVVASKKGSKGTKGTKGSTGGSKKTASKTASKPASKPANAAANAAAGKPKLPSRAQDTRRMQTDCRVALYNDYRLACANSAKNGKPCDLIDACGTYGVGSAVWPVDQWVLPKEAIDQIGPQRVKEGRDCMTKVMWTNEEYKPKLEKCGGKTPMILTPGYVAPARVNAAAPVAARNSTKGRLFV